MFRRVLDKRALERLELNAGKLARSVLRGGGGGNTVSLPDQRMRSNQRRRAGSHNHVGLTLLAKRESPIHFSNPASTLTRLSRRSRLREGPAKNPS